MSKVSGKKKNMLIRRRYIVVDANDYKRLHRPTRYEKLIISEVQVDVKMANKSKPDLDTAKSSIDTEEDQTKEVVGHQLKFSRNVTNSKSSDVAAFIQPKYDESIDEKLPETVTLLTTPEGGKLYLVGTAHFSVESRNDVAMIIRAVQPQIVVVELCKSRIDVININEEALYQYATDLSIKSLIEIIRHFGIYNGLFQIMLYHMVKQLGIPPGGEFRTAFEEAKKIPNCIIQLADRPIDLTIQRTLRQFSLWEILKLPWLMAQSKFSISKEDVERYKQKCVIQEMVSLLRETYPTVEKTLITERNMYLTYHLQMATAAQHTAEGLKPPRIVGVVGIGHVAGIVENWGKVKASDIWPIIRIPPEPLSRKILKFTIKTSLLGATIYIGYKIIPLASFAALQLIKSSFEGLLEASAKWNIRNLTFRALY